MLPPSRWRIHGSRLSPGRRGVATIRGPIGLSALSCLDDPAGLREGDVIVAFNEQSIGSIHELHKMLMGDQIVLIAKLLIIRHTEKLELSILPAEVRASTP